MLKPLIAVLAGLVMISPSWGEEASSGRSSGLSVGYDEGVLVRGYILRNVAAHVGCGFYTVGPDTVGHQPLSRVSWKLGGEYAFKNFEKLRVSAFGEWREELNQGETGHAEGGQTLRYNQWNTIFRIGIRPEWFVLNQLSIDYKIGIQFIEHGTTYRLNDDKTGTQSNKSTYHEVGMVAGRSPFLQDSEILLNIGINLYLFKPPFLK